MIAGHALRVENAKVGDEVVLVDFGGRTRRVKVSSVGRLWMTVAGRAGKFSRLDGALKDYGQVYIQTVALHERVQHLDTVARELQDLGIEPMRIPRSKLEALLAAVKPILAPEPEVTPVPSSDNRTGEKP